MKDLRVLQITMPREVYVLLSRLVQRRVEQDTRPSEATKSAVIVEAVKALAAAEGIASVNGKGQ